MDAKKRAAPSSAPGRQGGANLHADRDAKKPRKVPLKWSEALHRDFVSAVFDIGVKHASPAVVLDTMLIQDKEVTSERVKSHLQKYRVHKERSKTEFMAEYDKALRRIKERGGAKWRPTDRFLGGDVAAAMSYYTMNPDSSMTMPIDMRMSNVAGPTNIPTPREEYTELTQDGAVYSDHRPASRHGSGNDVASSKAAKGVPMPSPTMHPVVSSGTLKGELDESSRINLPNLTEEEANSTFGRKLRQLADDYNATIGQLLEGRKSREGDRRSRSQQICQDSRDSLGSHRRTSTESHGSHHHAAAAATTTHHYDGSMYHQGHYMQYPIHPQGYVPPDKEAQASSSALHHHYSGYDYYSQPTSSKAPAPAPVSYSIGPSSAKTRPGKAHNQDDSSTQNSSIKLEESKATPLYDSQRLDGDGRYTYGMPPSGDRGRGRSSGHPSNNNSGSRGSSPVPDFKTSRPSPAASLAASPAASPIPTRSTYHHERHNHPGADLYHNHHHPSYNNMYYNNNAGLAPSPSNQSWTHGCTDHNSSNHNGYPAYNYDSGHHYSQPNHHYDTHRGDTTSNRGTSSASAHIGQSSGQSSAPHRSSRDHHDHGLERERAKTPTSRIGGTDSLDLGDPWDDVSVQYSPIAH